MVQTTEILGNKKIIDILQFFANNPSIEISQTKLIKKTKLAKATAVKWTDMLVKNNFLIVKKIGATNIYRLNNENNIIKQLKIIDNLFKLQELNKLKEKQIEIYLYGSCARGENTEQSDIDLLIIGELKKKDIIENIEKLSEKINKRISFNIFSNLDWSMMAKNDRAYYERVEKDKIRLV